MLQPQFGTDNTITISKITGGSTPATMRHDKKNRNQIWVAALPTYLLTRDQAIAMATRLVELCDQMDGHQNASTA